MLKPEAIELRFAFGIFFFCCFSFSNGVNRNRVRYVQIAVVEFFAQMGLDILFYWIHKLVYNIMCTCVCLFHFNNSLSLTPLTVRVCECVCVCMRFVLSSFAVSIYYYYRVIFIHIPPVYGIIQLSLRLLRWNLIFVELVSVYPLWHGIAWLVFPFGLAFGKKNTKSTPPSTKRRSQRSDFFRFFCFFPLAASLSCTVFSFGVMNRRSNPLVHQFAHSFAWYFVMVLCAHFKFSALFVFAYSNEFKRNKIS